MGKCLPISTKTVWPNPNRTLNLLGGIVSGPSRSLAGRLFACPYRVAVSCLRWGDLLNTPPPATVLMKECLIWFAVKTKSRGESEGMPWGEVILHFLKIEWVRSMYATFRGDSGEPNLDFRICRPLMYESELGTFESAPAFLVLCK